MPFVLDNSVVGTWLLGEDPAQAADLARWLEADGPALVPTLWALELANLLLVAERRGRLTEADVAAATVAALALPIRVVELSPRDIVEHTTALGRTHRLTAYDAVYLHLALTEAVPLATRDARLADAATRAGVTLLR